MGFKKAIVRVLGRCPNIASKIEWEEDLAKFYLEKLLWRDLI